MFDDNNMVSNIIIIFFINIVFDHIEYKIDDGQTPL